MTFLILAYIFVMAAKKLSFYGEKRANIFVKYIKFRFLSKIFPVSGFSIVVHPNEGVQLKDRLF